eukprot:1160327-Pelagomonas_calceolata.AAC.2
MLQGLHALPQEKNLWAWIVLFLTVHVISQISKCCSQSMHDLPFQVAKVCAEMKGISELANGFNAIGFSQGGQFMRVSEVSLMCCLRVALEEQRGGKGGSCQGRTPFLGHVIYHSCSNCCPRSLKHLQRVTSNRQKIRGCLLREKQRQPLTRPDERLSQQQHRERRNQFCCIAFFNIRNQDALVERCSHDGIQARSLITLGAQHQGIASVPGCRWVIPLSLEFRNC